MLLKRTLISFGLLVIVSALPLSKGFAQGDNQLKYREIFHIDPINEPSINCIGWSVWRPDGTQIAIVDFPVIHIIDTDTWEISLTIEEAFVDTITWNPDGTEIAGTRGEDVFIWNVSIGALEKHLVRDSLVPRGILTVYHLTWSPDGEKIAIDSSNADVLIWDLNSDTVYEMQSHFRNGVGEIDWSPDSSRVVSVGADDKIRTWNIDTLKAVVLTEGSGLVDWHPVQDEIVGSGLNNEIVVWSTDSGVEQLIIENEAVLTEIKWNFDGSKIAAGDLQGDVDIWDVQAGELIATLEAHTESVMSLSWHPNLDLLASTGYDCEMRVWELLE